MSLARTFGVIGLSLFTLDNPYLRQLADSAVAEGRRLGYEVRVVGSAMDGDRQTRQVETFLTNGVCAVALAPVDALRIGRAIRAANAAGVPVFTVDTACSDPNARVVAHVATDNYGGGKQIAHTLVSAFGERGGTVAIINNPLLESCQERVRGFKTVLAAHNAKGAAPVRIVVEETGGTERSGGCAAAERIMAAPNPPDAIFALNDLAALGVWEVLERLPPARRPLLVAFDASKAGRQAVRSGAIRATAMQYPDLVGEEIVRVIVRHLLGAPVPAETLIPTSLYR